MACTDPMHADWEEEGPQFIIANKSDPDDREKLKEAGLVFKEWKDDSV